VRAADQIDLRGLEVAPIFEEDSHEIRKNRVLRSRCGRVSQDLIDFREIERFSPLGRERLAKLFGQPPKKVRPGPGALQLAVDDLLKDLVAESSLAETIGDGCRVKAFKPVVPFLVGALVKQQGLLRLVGEEIEVTDVAVLRVVE